MSKFKFSRGEKSLYLSSDSTARLREEYGGERASLSSHFRKKAGEEGSAASRTGHQQRASRRRSFLYAALFRRGE